jgi:type VI secretion system protein ImpJ
MSMGWKSKVVWAEGMLLTQQHFQQQERYWAAHSYIKQRGAICTPWGFTELEFDSAASDQGKLALIKACGIFPDGTTFEMPGTDPLPEPLEIHPTWRDLSICLALPINRPDSLETDAHGTHSLVRFNTQQTLVADSNAQDQRTAPIQTGQLATKLLSRADGLDPYSSLACVHIIERRPDNRLALNTQFIPPILNSTVSSVLKQFLHELAGLLEKRADALASRMTAPGTKAVSDIADFLLLQTANRFEPVIKQLASTPLLHPQDLYNWLLMLAGDLSSFGDTRRTRQFSNYLHDDLTSCFEPLMIDLRKSLSLVLEQSAIQIELLERKFGVRVAILSDTAQRKNAQFVLAVNAQLPSSVLRQKFPTQVKIGPVERIRDLVNMQLPGVAISALSVAPRQIPFHSGWTYFELETRASELWNQLDHSGGLAVHIAGDFPGIELSLWAIRT